MSAPTHASTIQADLQQEFVTARLDWLHAREHLAGKDSVHNREAVTLAAEEIDAVLDMWLDLRGDCE